MLIGQNVAGRSRFFPLYQFFSSSFSPSFPSYHPDGTRERGRKEFKQSFSSEGMSKSIMSNGGVHIIEGFDESREAG
jgi:hypothetical protein